MAALNKPGIVWMSSTLEDGVTVEVIPCTEEDAFDVFAEYVKDMVSPVVARRVLASWTGKVSEPFTVKPTRTETWVVTWSPVGAVVLHVQPLTPRKPAPKAPAAPVKKVAVKVAAKVAAPVKKTTVPAKPSASTGVGRKTAAPAQKAPVKKVAVPVKKTTRTSK